MGRGRAVAGGEAGGAARGEAHAGAVVMSATRREADNIDVHRYIPEKVWDNMTILNVKIVVWSIDVGWNDRSELTAILIGITTIQYINHSF